MLQKTTKNILKATLATAMASSFALLSGCTTVPASYDIISKDAVISKTTKTQRALQALSAPNAKVTVAVYEFEDKTGQFKPTEAGQTLSRAVSQGGDELLIKALQDAGSRSWFTIIERSNLNNLLKERQIITEMRSRYLGEKTINSKALPPLLFAGVIFEGAIVGFDANTVTGGAAARYLGIGGQTDYRQNVVSVHLRAVSVKTGEVLASVTTEKTIASVGISANAFRFVTFDNLLEADAGITSNEPGLLALRQAIEKSVYAMIMEGSEIGLWNFQDQAAGMALLREYRYERDGEYPEHVSLAHTTGASKTAQQQLVNPTPQRPVKTVRKAAPKPVKAASPVKTASNAPAVKTRPAPVVQKPVAKPMSAQQFATRESAVEAPPVVKVSNSKASGPAPKVVLAPKPAPIAKATPVKMAAAKTIPAPVKPVSSQTMTAPAAAPIANVQVASKPAPKYNSITDYEVILTAPAAAYTAGKSIQAKPQSQAPRTVMPAAEAVYDSAHNSESARARALTVTQKIPSLIPGTQRSGALP